MMTEDVALRIGLRRLGASYSGATDLMLARYESLRASGFGEDDALAQVAQDALLPRGGPLGDFLDAADSTWRAAQTQAGHAGQIEWATEKAGPTDRFAWRTVGDGRVCEDCRGRHGKILSMDDWDQVGPPGTLWPEPLSGETWAADLAPVCCSTEIRCRCELDPEDGFDGEQVNLADEDE